MKFKDLWTSKCNISVNKLCQNTKLGSLSQIIFAGNVGFRKDSWTVFSCTVLGKWFPNTGNSFCSDKSNFLQSDSRFPRTATSTLSVTTPCHLHLPLFELAEVLLRLKYSKEQRNIFNLHKLNVLRQKLLITDYTRLCNVFSTGDGHICQFCHTNALFRLVKLHQKMHKFATK